VLEANPIESDAPDLHLECGVFRKSLREILIETLLDKKLSRSLLDHSWVGMPLPHLLRGELGHLEWP
jgi:hypothetical protein